MEKSPNSTLGTMLFGDFFSVVHIFALKKHRICGIIKISQQRIYYCDDDTRYRRERSIL